MPTAHLNPLTVPPPARRLRVLYADDLADLRQLFSIVLGADGHTVETAVDGQDALDRVRAAPDAFDLVITDHHMPRLGGLELVQQLRQLPYRGKILVFSSELSRETNQAYADLRVDHILAKPIFPVTLRALVGTM